MATDLQRCRKRIFRAILARDGSLTCEYCGKANLVVNYQPVAGFPHPHNMATIDHIVPISKGGDRTDISNIFVCCYQCNTEKGDLDHEAFARKQEAEAGALLDKAARIRDAWWRKVERMREAGAGVAPCQGMDSSI